MKRLIILLALFSFTGSVMAEITGWWGVVSFRERYEEIKEYTDYTFQGEPGTLRYTDTNAKTRVGYKFGFKMKVSDNLWAGLTFRSGIGSVMWQDINKADDLLPGLQEAYLNWDVKYALIQMGKIPQDGNAMWDLYAAANQTDSRIYDPRDGIFNDRLSAINGARLKAPFKFYSKVASEIGGYKLPKPTEIASASITPRATYHADYMGGSKRDYFSTDQGDESALDWYAFFIGANLEYKNILMEYNLDFDYGFPSRLGDKRKQDDKDSIYVDETIWGMTHTIESPAIFGLLLEVGYGNNWRDSIFTATFWDFKAGAEYAGFRLTSRYQYGVQEHEFGNYAGSKAIREAMHLYLNKTIFDLDIQPRIIWFRTDIDPPEPELTGGNYTDELKQKKSNVRMEITFTARF